MDRRTALAIVTVSLAGCGGGDSARPVVAVYGDSLASGQLATEPGEPVRYLAVPPTQRLQQMLPGVTVLDRAEAGATVRHALASFRPVGDVIVLRFGGADAILGTPVADFARDLAELVRLARASGASVVLVGLPPHHAHDDALVRLDSAARGIGGAFVDLRSLGAGDFADEIHPSQEFSDRHTAAIAATVRGLL